MFWIRWVHQAKEELLCLKILFSYKTFIKGRTFWASEDLPDLTALKIIFDASCPTPWSGCQRKRSFNIFFRIWKQILEYFLNSGCCHHPGGHPCMLRILMILMILMIWCHNGESSLSTRLAWVFTDCLKICSKTV